MAKKSKEKLLAKPEEFFKGKYDKNNAILSIYSGAGGIEAQDWAEMLLRMYLKYAKHKDWSAKVLQIKPGKEAGIKQAVLSIEAPYAYGYLKGEAGVHRLVRLSPFNADHLRQTSFALVDVLPELKEIKEIEIRPEDLRIETYRASGPGGQYVNKTESAVRITHLPTGLTAACQSERLQGENKKRAMKLLVSKLQQMKLASQEQETRRIRGELMPAEWGSQIRSYVLHPYKMVKDHRTGTKSSEPEAVLDGQLDKFIISNLKKANDRV
jgi:peptide chain release factor 2